jgi:ATP-dependent exoDNAse (exonuclease V) beta subunit
LPDEIWILDYKTDVTSDEGLANKVTLYAPQLRAYGLALEKIYQRPVTELWLCFLMARENARLSRDRMQDGRV